MGFRSRQRAPKLKRYVRKGSTVRNVKSCLRNVVTNCREPETDNSLTPRRVAGAQALCQLNLPKVLRATSPHWVMSPVAARSTTPRRLFVAGALLNLSIAATGNPQNTVLNRRSPVWKATSEEKTARKALNFSESTTDQILSERENEGVKPLRTQEQNDMVVDLPQTKSVTASTSCPVILKGDVRNDLPPMHPVPTPGRDHVVDALLSLSKQPLPSSAFHQLYDVTKDKSPGLMDSTLPPTTNKRVKRGLDLSDYNDMVLDASDGVAPLPPCDALEDVPHGSNVVDLPAPQLTPQQLLDRPYEFFVENRIADNRDTLVEEDSSRKEVVQPLPKQVPMKRVVLSFEFCMSLDRKEFLRLTGLYQSQFYVLLDFLGRDAAEHLKYKFDRGTPKKNLSPMSVETRLMITLLRLRRGWDVLDLALFFGVSAYTVSKTVYTWVQFMYKQFLRMKSAMFVSRHDQLKRERPKAFKSFKNYRVCIDTTEIRIQAPDNFEQQGNTYSDYKAGNVWLYLIGISCWGGCSFISAGFEGSMSDREIYKSSGIRDFLEEGDVILADRGFTIEEECDEDGVICVHPPFMRNRRGFLPEEEQLTKEVATARIFVEHIMRRIKTFCILKKNSNSMLHYLDAIVYVCGCLTNFRLPIVRGT